MGEDQPHMRFWGKARGGSGKHPFHLLPYHLLDAGAVAEVSAASDPRRAAALAQALGLDVPAFVRLLKLLAAVHDVGKFCPGFQTRVPSILFAADNPSLHRPTSVHHTDLGHLLWEGILSPAILEGRIPGFIVPEEARARQRVQKALNGAAACATGHHGRPSATVSNEIPLVPDEHIDGPTAGAATTFLEEAAPVLFDGETMDLTPFAKDGALAALKRVSWSLAGWVVFADWLGSDDSAFPFESQAMPLKTYWQERALPSAKTAVARAGTSAQPPAPPALISELFPRIARPTPMQRILESMPTSDGPLLLIIEDATGSGKTEAALIGVQHLISRGQSDGLYFALPTMATSNAMHGRLATVYHKLYAQGSSPSLVLAHGRRDFVQGFKATVMDVHGRASVVRDASDGSAEAQCSAWLSDRPKKALLAHVGVGTVDQALLGVLPVRHQCLRLLGLARKTVIVDEVHAYDVYMLPLLEELIRFQAGQGSSVVLISATLPILERRRLMEAFREAAGAGWDVPAATEYPLLVRATRDAVGIETPSAPVRSSKPKEVRYIETSNEAVTILLEAAREGRAACWIRNTVADALAAHEELTRRSGAPPILFHARFALADRLAIETEVTQAFGPTSASAQRRGRIMIATQVAEQSLDLDFDTMVVDLAPVDVMIQRAGRLHRHPRLINGDRAHGPDDPDQRGPATLTILGPTWSDQPSADWYAKAFPRAAHVYPDAGRLWLTAEGLRQRKTIDVPAGIRTLVEHVYSEDSAFRVPEGLRYLSMQVEGEQKAKESYGKLEALSLQRGYWEQHPRFIDDVRAKTRLGDPQRPLYLARWDGQGLQAWIQDDGHDDWEGSRVDVRPAIATETAAHPEPLKKAIAQVLPSLPGRGLGAIVLPLTQGPAEEWHGPATRDRKMVQLTYSAQRGLEQVQAGGSAA